MEEVLSRYVFARREVGLRVRMRLDRIYRVSRWGNSFVVGFCLSRGVDGSAFLIEGRVGVRVVVLLWLRLKVG